MAVSYRRSTTANARGGRRVSLADAFRRRPYPGPMGRIPDKPTLDGIEARWADALGGRRHVPLRPHAPSGPTCSRSTRRRRRCRARSTWAPCSATPRPTPSPATSGWPASRCSSRSGGTTTAWPPSAGCRTSTACAATRRSRTTPSFQPPFRGDTPKGHHEIPISRPNFVELCHELTATDEAAFEDLFRRLGLSYDWSLQVRDDQRRQPAHEPAGVPPQPRPRRGVQRRGADGVGRRRPHRRRPGRDRGPRAARRLPPAGVPRRPTATS